jgi:hypothetical protein
MKEFIAKKKAQSLQKKKIQTPIIYTICVCVTRNIASSQKTMWPTLVWTLNFEPTHVMGWGKKSCIKCFSFNDFESTKF